MLEPAEQLIEDHGTATAAVDYGGTGPDVVLLHGGNRNLLDWTPLRPLLPGMRLVAYDLRGHGRSGVPPDADYSFGAHLEDLDAVLRHFRLERPVLVGHSIGGNIAVAAAGSPRFDVAGAASIDGYGPGVYDGADRSQRQAELDSEVYAALEPDTLPAEAVPDLVTRYAGMMRSIGADPELASITTSRSLADREDGSFARRPPMSHQQALAAGLQGFDFFRHAHASPVPILVIKGNHSVPVAHLSEPSQDFVSRLERGARAELARLGEAAHAEVREVEGGHMLHLEATAEIAALLEDFVARTSAPRG